MPASPALMPRLAATRRRSLLILGALFTFFFAAYIFTASADFYNNGDTLIRIQVASNYVEGRIFLSGWKLEYPHHIKKEYFDPRISLGRDHLTYSTYLPGQPLVIVPFEMLGVWLAAHERWPLGPSQIWFGRLVGPLFGALEVTLFFLFAVRLGYGLRRSLLLTLVLGFATSVWPDEQSVLEHTEVAFFLLLGMYFAFRYREQGGGWKYLVYAGAGMGGAAITRYQDAFLGLVALGLYLILPGGPPRGIVGRIRDLILCGIGLLPFAVTDLVYDYARFGSPFASGHHETVFGYPIWKGALGLTVSPGKGLLWYCPVIFLLVWAGPRFARRYGALSLSIVAMCAGFFLLYGYVQYWHGDPAWGPRYVYPLVPFLTLPLGEIFMVRLRKAPVLWSAAVLVIGASFVIQLSGVAVSEWRSWYRVISYEENQGYEWTWIAARYRYFWNIHESPLNFQVHGLYQLAYDGFLNRSKYELVPPDEDPILDNMTVDYAINHFNFWWTSNEFNWWMGQDKIVAGVLMLLAVMLASGTYLTSEALGVFALEPSRQPHPRAITEAA